MVCREEMPNWSTPEYVVLLKDGVGRSHQDVAIRSLGIPVNLAFALNTAVYAGVQNATHKSGASPEVA